MVVKKLGPFQLQMHRFKRSWCYELYLIIAHKVGFHFAIFHREYIENGGRKTC